MTNSNVITLNKPEQNDSLQEVLREGARKMLAAAIEAEIAIFIEQHSALQTDEGKTAVVRKRLFAATTDSNRTRRHLGESA